MWPPPWLQPTSWELFRESHCVPVTQVTLIPPVSSHPSPHTACSSLIAFLPIPDIPWYFGLCCLCFLFSLAGMFSPSLPISSPLLYLAPCLLGHLWKNQCLGHCVRTYSILHSSRPNLRLWCISIPVCFNTPFCWHLSQQHHTVTQKKGSRTDHRHWIITLTFSQLKWNNCALWIS